METRGKTGLYIACALGVILVAGALYYFFGTNTFNHSYGLPEANQWVAAYDDQNPAPKGWLANADNIETYLNSSASPAYIHISLGLDDAGNQVLILSGVRK